MSDNTLKLVSSKELANYFGFASANDGFRAFCRNLGITPLRRNPSFFDPVHVRNQMNIAQGIASNLTHGGTTADLVEERRARRAAQ